jgi:hypothetical protein
MSESVVYHKDLKLIEDNNKNFGFFVNSLKNPQKREGNKRFYLWNNVPADSIIELFGKIHTHEDSIKADSALIQRYIKSRESENELLSWTIILLSGGDGDSIEVGGFPVECMKRTTLTQDDPNSDKFTIRRLVSPRDEWLDFDLVTQQEIMRKTRDEYKGKKKKKESSTPKTPAGPVIREMRKKENGLLLLYPLDLRAEDKGVEKKLIKTIGFAVSFPFSQTTGDVSYRVNKVYWDSEIRP